MVDHFRPGEAAPAPCSKVELSVSCKNLTNMDYFSKSDPMCVLFVKETGTADRWMEFGRTEVIDNNLNPEFAKKFLVDYFFEERQLLRFEVYDIDSSSTNLRDHDFLGRIEVSLGEIVSSGRLERPLILPSSAAAGTISGAHIVVAGEELASCKEEVTFQFEGRKLDKKGWLLAKSDPFLAFYRMNEDNSFTIAHRTNVIKNTLNPRWPPFKITARGLCGGDYERTIKIRCISGNEDLIGECETNLKFLSQCGSGKEVFMELVNPSMKSKSGYKNSGTLILKSLKIETAYTFLDYVQAGTQLNCTIGIDFTASNGDPTRSDSLHYIHPYYPNQYQQALTAVGEIIQDYDSDKLFPVLGFGARLPPDGAVSHEFFVNGHPSNPFCPGIAGVVDAYQRCLRSVQLYGPTNFAPIINHVARFAAAVKNGAEYFILLIITDGAITDMEKTKEAIVNAAPLPLSIIIVGVGNANFDAMRELDGDEVRISSFGRYAERDIVQFVPFRDFIRGGNNPADSEISKARLAKEVLAEIPDQFVSYMKKFSIVPGSWPKMRQQQPPPSSFGGGPTVTAPSPFVAQPPPPPPGQAPNPQVPAAHHHQQQQMQQQQQPPFSPPPPYATDSAAAAHPGATFPTVTASSSAFNGNAGPPVHQQSTTYEHQQHHQQQPAPANFGPPSAGVTAPPASAPPPYVW